MHGHPSTRSSQCAWAIIYRLGERRWVRLTENKTERRELVDCRLEAHLDQYLAAARITDDPTNALFHGTLTGNKKIAARSANRTVVMSMIRRRIKAISHPPTALAKGGRGLAPYGDDLQRLIDSIEPVTVTDLRDRAIIGLILYASTSPRAIAALRIGDYYVEGNEHWLNVIERAATAVVPPLDSLLREYLSAARIGDARTTPLFYARNRNSVQSPRLTSSIWFGAERPRRGSRHRTGLFASYPRSARDHTDHNRRPLGLAAAIIAIVAPMMRRGAR
jgi:hypothetical protein